MRGITDWLTAEATTEMASDLHLGGGGVVLNLGGFALGHVAGAASTAAGQNGWQTAFGMQRTGPRLSTGATVTLASRNFRDLASLEGSPTPRHQIATSIGFSLGAYGSLGLAYVDICRDQRPEPERFVLPSESAWPGERPGPGALAIFQPVQRAQVLTASYSLQLDRYALFATGFHDFADRDSSGFLLSLTIPLGVRSSASVSGGAGQGRATGQAQLAQSTTEVGQWGYRTSISGAKPSSGFAEAQYRSPWGLVTAGVDQMERETTYRATARGALALAGGGVFASNSIGDSFAVVETEDTAGVRVTNDNRPVGRTDSSGRILVPDLLSFQANRIAVEPADLPFDADVPATTREVRPQYRSGVIVRFPLRPRHGALVRLVDELGQPLPLGSTGMLEATRAASPVGHDGDLCPGPFSHRQPSPGAEARWKQLHGGVRLWCRSRHHPAHRPPVMYRGASMKLLLLGVALAAVACHGARAAQCGVSATTLRFGVYQAVSPAPTDTTGSVQITCQGSVDAFGIAISTGLSGSYAQRQMLGLGGLLAYQMYLDSARATVWGDGTRGTSIATGALPHGGGSVRYTVYGRIPASQRMRPGVYLDLIIVTVSW
jgi:spore coat protein U-like protein